jgi:phage shock protein PspC (stress-responsive transcriptional regulator)
MTTTPPEAPSGPPPQDPTGDSGPRVTRDEVRDLGRLRRSTTDRKVAGVAGGLGRHLDVDPLILRVAFVVLVFFGGAGLILYGACWLLVPEDGDDKAPFNLDERSRTIALMIVGVLAAVALVGDSWGAFWFPWPVAIVALIALWLLTRNNPPKAAAPPTAAPYGPAPYGPAAPPQENPYAAASQQAYYPPQPPYVAPPVMQRVPNPRKRGPILFWLTLALIALGEGLLGIADLAGANIADPAYPALAVAICGVMLVVGAFFGRAGGIILVGLIATVGLVGATAASEWEGDQVNVTPTTASSLDDRYWLDAGEQVIDLREVSDLSSLDGRTLEVEGGVGRIEVILPDGMGARVTADIDGPGQIDLFGEGHGGIDVNTGASVEGDPHMTIDAHLGVGEIEVSHR